MNKKLIYILYLFVLVCTLLVFGITGGWPGMLVEGLCFFLLLVHLLSLRRQDGHLYRVPGFLPLALLTGYVLVQLVPLPPLILKLLSPHTWELYAETVWLVRSDAWMPISISPKSTLTGFFRLAAYAAFYVLTVQVLAERERLKGAVSFFAICTGLFALAGLVMFLFSEGRFFWPLGELMSDSARPADASLNRSYYAGLMVMVLPVVLAQYLASRPRVNYSSLGGRVADFFRHPGANHYILLGFFLIPLTASFLLSFAPGVILSALAALLVFVLLLLIRRWIRGWGVLKGLSPAAVLLVIAMLGSGMIWGRPDLQEDRVQAERIREHLWGDSAKIIGDFPFLGTGLGTFGHVYPRYKTVESRDMEIEHAGNGYLEHMAEVGIVGTLLAGWFLFALVRQAYPLWRARHNRTSVYLGAGAFSGLVAILLHSITGSALQAGAIGLYVSFLAALIFAAAICRNRGKESAGREAASPAAARWTGVFAAVLLAASLIFNAGVFMGERKVGQLTGTAADISDAGQDRAEVFEAASQAMRLDPLESIYPYILADAGLASGKAERTLDLFASALRLDPLNAEYLQRLGLVFDNLGQRGKAEKLLRSGVENDDSNPERHKTFAFWLLSEGKKDRGLDHIRKAIYWGPEQTGDFLALMALYGLKDEEMQRILPERSYPLLAFGDYLLGIGKEKEAEENYSAAIDYALQEKWPSPVPFQRVTEFFSERARYNEALDVILAGIEIFPENADFRFMAANLYELLGIDYRAIEEYRGTLALDPGNQEARESLQRLVGDSN